MQGYQQGSRPGYSIPQQLMQHPSYPASAQMTASPAPSNPMQPRASGGMNHNVSNQLYPEGFPNQLLQVDCSNTFLQ